MVPKLWHKPVEWWMKCFEGRVSWWFGGRFWCVLAVMGLLVPCIEVIALTESGTLIIGFATTAANVVVIFLSLTLLAAISRYGLLNLTHETDIFTFLSSVYPEDWQRIVNQAVLHQRASATKGRSNARDLISEIMVEPFAHKVFRTVAARVMTVIAIVPVYCALALLALNVVPQEHLVHVHGRIPRAVHGIEIIRDWQMGMLAGSSTEHAPSVDTETSSGKFSVAEWWEFLEWEVFGVISVGFYLLMMLHFLPMQTSIFQNLDHQFRSRGFWEQLFLKIAPS